MPQSEQQPDQANIPRKDMLTITAYYGGRKICDTSTINLYPVEAEFLMRTICQLIIGIDELRKRETEYSSDHDFLRGLFGEQS